MNEKQWLYVSPLNITTTSNIDVGSILPPHLTSVSPSDYNHIFRYMIGDVFIDDKYGDTIELTGFNYTAKTYEGIITMNFGNKTKTTKTNMIFESRLNNMNMLIDKPAVTYKKDEAIRYRIYYFEEGSGNRSIQHDVQLSNIRALAKFLNSMVKVNPKRRIIMVAILDDNSTYVGQVKLLRKEIKEQKFLTGMKERLLAYAKYECGYEIATNF